MKRQNTQLLKMGYHSFNIRQGMKMVENSDFVLPALQRGFVWSDSDIEKLFDSIFKKYPFGSLLILNVDGKTEDREITTFYRFNKNATNDALFGNGDQINIFPDETKYCVLDGQQRLTALFRGINSCCKSKLGKNNISKSLYFDVLCKEDDDCWFKYKPTSGTFEPGHFYVKVQKLWNLEKDDVKAFVDGILGETEKENKDWLYKKNKQGQLVPNKSKKVVRDFFEFKNKFDHEKTKIIKSIKKFVEIFKNDNNVFSYNLISFDGMTKEEKIDRMLDIFIRLNNGGRNLKPSDLLYSQIATYSYGGELKVREAFDEFISILNDKHHVDANFKIDNYIRLLWLIFGDTSSFKTFYASNAIAGHCKKAEFDKVFGCLKKARKYFTDNNFQFSGKISYNMFLPVAYYFYYMPKDTKPEQDNIIKYEIAKYYELAIVSGYFSQHTDATLMRFRNAFRDGVKDNPLGLFTDGIFDFKKLQKKVNDLSSLTESKFALSQDRIDEILKLQYGKNNQEIKSILYVLNRDWQEEAIEDVDHLHPKKFSDEKKYREEVKNFAQEEFEFFEKTHNLLPNLQLLTVKENRNKDEKNGKPLDNWIEKRHKSDLKTYCEKNLIDNFNQKDYFKLDNYKKFFEDRQGTLEKKLKELFAESTQN